MTSLKPQSGDSNQERVQNGLAACLGVESGGQGLEERAAYLEAYAKYLESQE